MIKSKPAELVKQDAARKTKLPSRIQVLVTANNFNLIDLNLTKKDAERGCKLYGGDSIYIFLYTWKMFGNCMTK